MAQLLESSIAPDRLASQGFRPPSPDVRPDRPALRGLLHAAMFPVALVVGTVLVMVAPSGRERLGLGVFGLSAGVLFAVSGLYNGGRWGPRAYAFLQRFDHTNIFVFIAGTSTAFGSVLLSPARAVVLAALAWAGALAGVVFRVAWPGAPRGVFVPVYVALGAAPGLWLREFWRTGGPVVVGLLVGGGVVYALGAVAYTVERPNPWPGWFGFHEVFHLCTILAFSAHVVALAYALAPA